MPIAISAPELLRALDTRRSVPAKQLAAPAPDDATLLRILQSAVRVPDHGKRVPFRFVRLAGDARAVLGEVLAQRLQHKDPAVGEGALDKERGRFMHAPLVIVVVAVLDPDDDKAPDHERLMTAGCACFALLQALQAFGFGGHWLTGWPTYDRKVRKRLGLSKHERIAGFIHVGTPKLAAPERTRPDPASLLRDWTG